MSLLFCTRPARYLLLLAFASCAIQPELAVVDGPITIATWPFGRFANEQAMQAFADGRSRLDAVELGIREIERRSSDGSVGLGGRPNAAGYPQLDACIMDGPGHRAGSVAGLEGIVHPISVARLVMEKCRHVMLVGEGARWFALEHGVESVDVSSYEPQKADWQRGRRPQDPDTRGHDTVTLLVRDADGHLAGGCSTSGAGGKVPGRVGDSPILGAGLYVDEEVGAAGGTGIGENIMRHCGTYLIVELMRQGMNPQAACEEAIHRMAAKDPRGYDLSVSFIALDKRGRVGAASSSQSFPFAVATSAGNQVLSVEKVTPR